MGQNSRSMALIILTQQIFYDHDFVLWQVSSNIGSGIAMIGYAIIGCGSIGRKRAEAIKKIGELVGCFDANPSQSEKLACDYQCRQFGSINDLLENQSVQAIVVSTLHDTLTDLTIRSLAAGKYVLVEKPAARNKNELEKVIQQQSKSTAKVRVGLNHRYHPAIQKAKSLIDIGAIGKILFIRGRYGHGGRIGYEKEWRADPKISGGGELLDQGPHLIDLCHWMMGDVRLKFGLCKTYFGIWKSTITPLLSLKQAPARSRNYMCLVQNGRTFSHLKSMVSTASLMLAAWAVAMV